MNLFAESKKVLDKDGKVNPLGPYGKMKLTGREVSAYFRRNKISDPQVKKAVEVALDMGGAMDIAGKEIQKFFGREVRNAKEVKSALQYANESFIANGKSLDEDFQKVIKMFPRDQDWKKLITKHKKAINDFRKNNKDLPSKVEDELIGWASQTGAVGHKDDVEDFIMSILDEKFKPYTIKGSERVVDFEIQFRSKGFTGQLASSDQAAEKDWNQAKKIVSAYSKTHKLNIKDAKGAPVYSDPRKGSSAFKVGVFAKNNTNDKNHDLRPLVDQLAKLKTAEDHGGGYGKPIKEETISEGKNLMPAIQKIVDDKGAAKVGGVMVDMFTASVLTQAYAKVNDSNKKKMESSNIQVLVKLAQRVMGLKEQTLTEGMSKLLSPAQQAGVLKKWNEPEGSTFAKEAYSNAKIANKKDFIVTSHPVKDGDYYLSLLGNAPEGKEDKPLTQANTNMNADIRKICAKWSKSKDRGYNPAGMAYLQIEKELCEKKYNKFAADDTMVRDVVWGMVEDLMNMKIKTA